MKILIAILLCFCLTSCTYSSANMMRVSGDHVKVFGAWGYVECTKAAVTMWTGRSCTSTKKEDYVKVSAMPDIKETKEEVNIEHK